MNIDTEKLLWTASDEVFSRIDQMEFEKSEALLFTSLKEGTSFDLVLSFHDDDQNLEVVFLS